MTRKKVCCGYCNDVLGYLHKKDESVALKRHFEEKHQKELNEIQEAKKHLKELKNKYCFNVFYGLI